jgi:thioredoxin-like negative regulator of GroEL
LAQAVVEEKDIAVFFHSKTCGSCAKLEADILANVGSIPGDVKILKADRDENQDLASTFNVDKFHTVAYV